MRYLYINDCRNSTVGNGLEIHDDYGRRTMFDSRNKRLCVKRWRKIHGETGKHFEIIDCTTSDYKSKSIFNNIITE